MHRAVNCLVTEASLELGVRRIGDIQFAVGQTVTLHEHNLVRLGDHHRARKPLRFHFRLQVVISLLRENPAAPARWLEPRRLVARRIIGG